MCRSHDCQTSLASKWALAPLGESATLNIHSAAYEFQTAPFCCMLKEIGKRLGEVNWNGLLDECWEWIVFTEQCRLADGDIKWRKQKTVQQHYVQRFTVYTVSPWVDKLVRSAFFNLVLSQQSKFWKFFLKFLEIRDLGQSFVIRLQSWYFFFLVGQRQTLPRQHSLPKDRETIVEEVVREIDLTCCGTSPLLPPTAPLLFHLAHHFLVGYQSLVCPLFSSIHFHASHLQAKHKRTEDINHRDAVTLSDSLVTLQGVATVSLHQGSLTSEEVCLSECKRKTNSTDEVVSTHFTFSIYPEVLPVNWPRKIHKLELLII